MSGWEIARIVLPILVMIIAGSVGLKVWVDKIKATASKGLKELSEAFQASALLALKGEETLKKPDITVDDARACWLEMRKAGAEWSDVFAWAVGIYNSFHPG